VFKHPLLFTALSLARKSGVALHIVQGGSEDFTLRIVQGEVSKLFEDYLRIGISKLTGEEWWSQVG